MPTYTSGTTYNPGTFFNGTDPIVVDAGALIIGDGDGVFDLEGTSGTQNYTVTINGAVVDHQPFTDITSGIYFHATSGSHTLTIGATGSIFGGSGGGVYLISGNVLSSFTNNGVISTNSSSFGAIEALGDGDSTWTNNGLIYSDLTATIIWGGSGAHTFTNTGVITAAEVGDRALFSDNAAGIEIITNSGVINGKVDLGGGADQFNTFDGRVNGEIDMGAGTDIFSGSDSSFGDNANGGDDGDTMGGARGNDTLNGGAGDDTIAGNEGDDTLVGGTHETTGDLVDYYYTKGAVTVSLAVTTVQNTGAAGTDTISEFERLSGSNEFGDTLSGSTGINDIYGMGGNDILFGGNDLVADTLVGNNIFEPTPGDVGNDTYIVRTNDVIVEEADKGTADKVRAQTTFVLAADDHIEIMETYSPTGTTAIDLTGNDLLGQKITGNAGANALTGLGGEDTINGGKGNDFLSGGVGADKFVFDSALSGTTNVDTISTVSSLDKIVLDNDIFKQLGSSFTSGEFKAINSGTSFSTVDSSDNIIYVKSNGKLYYDADGNGAAAKVQFADLADGTALVFTQFQMIE